MDIVSSCTAGDNGQQIHAVFYWSFKQGTVGLSSECYVKNFPVEVTKKTKKNWSTLRHVLIKLSYILL
jgi:hypothetical protein